MTSCPHFVSSRHRSTPAAPCILASFLMIEEPVLVTQSVRIDSEWGRLSSRGPLCWGDELHCQFSIHLHFDWPSLFPHCFSAVKNPPNQPHNPVQASRIGRSYAAQASRTRRHTGLDFWHDDHLAYNTTLEILSTQCSAQMLAPTD